MLSLPGCRRRCYAAILRYADITVFADYAIFDDAIAFRRRLRPPRHYAIFFTPIDFHATIFRHSPLPPFYADAMTPTPLRHAVISFFGYAFRLPH